MRKLDYGEADRIYTLLTRDHGKVGAIARGVRKTSSKLASSLELFGAVDVLLAHGRSLDVIAQAERLPGPRLDAEVTRTAYASLIAELADRVTEDRHPSEGVYELTTRAMSELARESDPRRASIYYLSAALELLGYAPQLDACIACDRPLRPEPAAFTPAIGGFLCSDCAEPGRSLVSPAAIKVLRVMAAGDLALFRRLKLDEPVLEEVERVLESQLEYHLDARLKSLQFLRRLRRP